MTLQMCTVQKLCKKHPIDSNTIQLNFFYYGKKTILKWQFVKSKYLLILREAFAVRFGDFRIINSCKYEKLPIRIFSRNRKRGFCNTVQNPCNQIAVCNYCKFPMCKQQKKYISDGNFCHFKFCYNKINQFCNTVQNLATKLPSAITATLFFFQLLLCVVILVRNSWFLSPPVPSKREKNIQTETTQFASVFIFF